MRSLQDDCFKVQDDGKKEMPDQVGHDKVKNDKSPHLITEIGFLENFVYHVLFMLLGIILFIVAFNQNQ